MCLLWDTNGEHHKIWLEFLLFYFVLIGGSLSNMYGMMLARHRLAPEAKQKGISSIKPLVVFTSEDVS